MVMSIGESARSAKNCAGRGVDLGFMIAESETPAAVSRTELPVRVVVIADTLLAFDGERVRRVRRLARSFYINLL